MVICKICNRQFSTDKGLSYHITHAHNTTLEKYYLDFECNDVINAGKCCICGKPTPFISRLEGYQKTCCQSCGGKAGAEQGHQTMLRIYGKKALNNPDKNKQYYLEHPEAKEAAISKLVEVRKNNNSYVSGGYKAKLTHEKNICNFLIENDCTLPYKLVEKFGQGWYKAQDKILDKSDYIFTNLLGKNNTYCIKNTAIKKIEAYYNENKFNQTSHSEKDVVNFIKEIYAGDIIENTRSIIPPYELDIYIPDKKIAIEYNGTFWHSEQANTDRSYHFLKSFLCEKAGIRLIHIFEFEWADEIKRNILKSIVRNSLGKNNEFIYARKCIIKELTKNEVYEFSNLNSLHGHRNATIYLGLYYENELVEVMTFGKAFFSRDTTIDYECIRSVTKLNTTVIGGMNKLFNYFIQKYNPNTVLYYVDYNTHIGSSMEKLNFKFIKYSKYGIRNVIRHPEKDVDLVEKFGGIVFNRRPSENNLIKQLIKDKKVFTIYDAGVKKYIWKQNKNINQ